MDRTQESNIGVRIARSENLPLAQVLCNNCCVRSIAPCKQTNKQTRSREEKIETNKQLFVCVLLYSFYLYSISSIYIYLEGFGMEIIIHVFEL